ncbi:MAG: hypothetical protein JW910_16890 [Anaerolineae bacterium]|nr:hypothetical protein [Anaerolineae bacterium]
MFDKKINRREFLKVVIASAAAAGLSHFRFLNFGGVLPVQARECENGEEPDDCVPGGSTDWCIPASSGGGDADICALGDPMNPDMCPDDSPGGHADICDPALQPPEPDECWPEMNEPDTCAPTATPKDPDICLGDTTGDGDVCIVEQDPDVCILGPETGGGEPDVCLPGALEADVCVPLPPYPDPDICLQPPDSDMCGAAGIPDVCGEGPFVTPPDTCEIPNPDSCEPAQPLPGSEDKCEPATGELDTCEPSYGEPDRCEPLAGESDTCIGDAGGDADRCDPLNGEADTCSPPYDPDECDPFVGDPDEPNRVSLNMVAAKSSPQPMLGAIAALGVAALLRPRKQ